jgi:hypothetical protein
MAGACRGKLNINDMWIDYDFAVKGPQNGEVQINLKFRKVPVEPHFAFLALLYATHYIANDFGFRLDLQKDKPDLPDVADELVPDEEEKH